MTFQPPNLEEVKARMLQGIVPALRTDEEEFNEMQQLLLEQNDISESEDDLDDDI